VQRICLLYLLSGLCLHRYTSADPSLPCWVFPASVQALLLRLRKIDTMSSLAGCLMSVRAPPAGVQRGLSYPHTPPRVRSGGYLPSFAAIKAERGQPQGAEPPTGCVCHGPGDAKPSGFRHPSLPSSPTASRSGQLAAASPLRPGRSSAPELHAPATGGGGPAVPRPRMLAVGPAPVRICVRRHASAPPVRSLEELLGAYRHLRLAPHLSFDEVAAAAASAAQSAAAAVISAAKFEHALTAVRALAYVLRSPPTAR